MSTSASPTLSTWVGRCIGLLLAADIVVFLIQGANRPKGPSLAPLAPSLSTTSTTSSSPPTGL